MKEVLFFSLQSWVLISLPPGHKLAGSDQLRPSRMRGFSNVQRASSGEPLAKRETAVVALRCHIEVGIPFLQ